MKNYLKKIKFAAPLSVLLISFLFIQACSSTQELKSQDKYSNQKGEQSLYFTSIEDGQEVKYEVIFKDDKIVSLHRNELKVPSSEISKYDNIVYDKLNGMRKEIKKDDEEVFVFKFNSDEFKEKMKMFGEKFKDNEFKFEFDNEKFKADMNKLKEELKERKIVINLDKGKMKEHMKEMQEHLKEFEFITPEIDIDIDELNDAMNEIKIKIKKSDKTQKIEIDKLERDMQILKEEMSDLSIKMEDLDRELETLDNFLSELKKELVKDKLINSTDDEIELEMSTDKIKVNDNDVSVELLNKYKKMYESHFNKKLEGKKKFQVK